MIGCVLCELLTYETHEKDWKLEDKSEPVMATMLLEPNYPGKKIKQINQTPAWMT